MGMWRAARQPAGCATWATWCWKRAVNRRRCGSWCPSARTCWLCVGAFGNPNRRRNSDASGLFHQWVADGAPVPMRVAAVRLSASIARHPRRQPVCARSSVQRGCHRPVHGAPYRQHQRCCSPGRRLRMNPDSVLWRHPDTAAVGPALAAVVLTGSGEASVPASETCRTARVTQSCHKGFVAQKGDDRLCDGSATSRYGVPSWSPIRVVCGAEIPPC